jgi:hypothetical protein
MKQNADFFLKDNTALLFFVNDAPERQVLQDILERSTVKFYTVTTSCHDSENFDTCVKTTLCSALGLGVNSDWGRIYDALLDLSKDKEAFMFSVSISGNATLLESSRVIRVLVHAGIHWKKLLKPFIIVFNFLDSFQSIN